MPTRFLWVALAVVGSSVGCGKKSSTSGASPEITGLAAVPASAEVVIVADVARIRDAPLITRAVDQLLLRDPVLATRWQDLQASCKLDIKQFKHVVLATGPHTGTQPGTGPVLVVATGQLVETDFAACVRDMIGKGGGALTAKPTAGNKTLYEAKDGNRLMYFAFGRPDTVVMSSSEALVNEALGPGKKALDNRELATWIGLADQRMPLWAAGRVDPRVRDGLVKVMAGKVSQGPQAIIASFDPTTGAKLELDVIMANNNDAKELESYGKTQLGLMGMAAQAKGMGSLVDRIAITADQNLVRFKATLDPDDVNHLISVLDGGEGSAQVPLPSGSAGSSGP